MILRTNIGLRISPALKNKITKHAKEEDKRLNKYVSQSDIINRAVELYYGEKMSLTDEFKQVLSTKGDQVHKTRMHVFIDICLKTKLQEEAKKRRCRMSHIIEYALEQYFSKGE